MAVQRVLYGESGQSLRHTPPERVASATYQIEDLEYDADDPSRVLASGSATIDSLSLTSNAAAGDGQTNPSRISVASTTGATIGDPAVITAADGSFELFEIAAVSADSYIEARHPLIGLYPSGSTVRGLQLSASVPASVYDEEEYVEMQDGLRVVWEYTIGGVARKRQQQIRVVYQDEPDIELGEVESIIRDMHPDIVDRVVSPGEIRGWVQLAKRRLNGEFRANGQRPEQMMLGDEYNFCIAYLAMKIAGQNGCIPRNQEPDQFIDAMHKEYRSIANRYLTGKAGVETHSLDDISNSTTDSSARGIRGLFRPW